MIPPGADTAVIRYGEIGTKSRGVRGWMSRKLIDNLRALLDDRGVSGSIERREARIVIESTEADVEDATEAAADTFGATSASAARRVEPTVDAVTTALAETAREICGGGTFAVDAQRSGTHPFTSQELAREGGTAIWTAVGQKSSQTAQNLSVTSAATELPVHRPLLSVDKTDISQRARDIGTVRDSTLPAGCNRIVPDQAETNATPSRQREREPEALYEWAKRDAAAVETVDPRASF
jgi:adenylyl- and sulfurtransferase ThiI